MSIVHRTAAVSAVGALLLAGVAGCQDADDAKATGSETDGENSADELLGDLFYISRSENGVSKLLRWDGTVGGKVETVMEGDALMYDTINVSAYGEYVSWADSNEDGMFMTMPTDTGEAKPVPDLTYDADSCSVPVWASGTYPQLMVPGDGNTVSLYTAESGEISDPIPVDDTCDVLPANSGQADGVDVYYFNRETGDVEFSSYGEITATGVGAAVKAGLESDVVGLGAVSLDGAKVCVTVDRGTRTADGTRQLSCEAVVDTATGDIDRQAVKEPIQIRWCDVSPVERVGHEVRLYATSADLNGDPELTVPEPAELADAELLAVTSPLTVE